MPRVIVISIMVLMPWSGVLDAAIRPVVNAPTYAMETSRQLAAERLSARRESRGNTVSRSEVERLLDDVWNRYRMLAETLLNRGDRIGGDTGSRMVICATTMLNGQDEIENVLRVLTTNQLSDLDAVAVRADLVRFTQGIQAGLSRVPMTATSSPELIVIELMEPLRTACERASDRQAPTGWWPKQQVVTRPLFKAGEGVAAALDELDLKEALRTALESMPAEHRLRTDMIGLLTALDSYKWMDGVARHAIHEHLVLAVERASMSRELMDETLRRVVALHSLVDALGRLAQSPGGRAVATRRSSALIDILEAWPDQLPPAATMLMITDTINILAEAREVQDDGLSRFRTRVHVGLVRQRLQAERRVFESFGEVAASSAPWTDPGLVVILSEPRQLLEALHRLRQLESWRETAERLGPRDASKLIERLEVLVGAMADVTTRADAARALSEFERQLALFEHIEGESAIANTRFDPDGKITRGLARARSRWISDWSKGRSSGDGAITLYRYRRLLDHVRTLELLDSQGLQRSDRLAAWVLPIDMTTAAREQFRSDVEVFVDAIVADDLEKSMRVQVGLEEPYAVLHLAAVVSAAAPRFQTGDRALSGLGALTIKPDSNSFFVDHRGQMAQISHALLDVQSLIRQDREEEAQALQAWANQEATRVLRRLNVVPAAPLAVPGMRQGDLEIDGGSMQMMR
ncbi:MAG: hypothetical protein VX527_04255 [Planctomycetota bacterium]|nr:hypothetical protein [Planctomycetota bacterium]